MKHAAISIRSFIGARDFQISREFYQALGFQEVEIDKGMSLFRVNASLAFYLQDYYLKGWVENSMLVLEVDDLDVWVADLESRGLPLKFEGVRFTGIKIEPWGREIMMHDPAGVLWHFCEFVK